MSDNKKKHYQDEVRFSGKYSKSVFHTLGFAYRPYTGILLAFLFLGMCGRFLLLANANVIGIWVDTFCKNNEHIQCRPVPGFFADFGDMQFLELMSLMTLFGFLFSWIFRIGFSVVSARAVSQIYDETTYRTSRFPMSFFDQNPAGRIVTRFSSDYGNVFRLFGGPLAEFLSIIFDLVGMLTLVTFASPLYLPVIILVGFFNYLVYRLNRERLRTYRRELSLSRSPSIAHFAETTQGASTIRTFNRKHSFAARFSRLDSYFQQQKIKVTKNITLFSFQMNSLTALLLLLTGFLAIFLLRQGNITVGSLGVAFGFITLSGNTVQMFFDWLAQFEEAMIGVERLDNYLHMPLEPGAKLPSTASFATDHWRREQRAQNIFENAAASVEFKHVNFRYQPELPLVLQDVSFHVRAGEKIGIVGRTGSGKSSLMQALLYLYPIESGHIYIDGKTPQLTKTDSADDSHVDLESYRMAIGFISQEPTLFKGTLRENLQGTRQRTEMDLIKALEKVGLEEWANAKDLNMPIEEKGKNLSLGEKQLICMARCLLQQCPVIVMDEATSSVDPRSEAIMVKATNEFFADRTQIIIAHRLTTLLRCDRILWLQHGHIKMLGTPNEVLPAFSAADLTAAHTTA